MEGWFGAEEDQGVEFGTGTEEGDEFGCCLGDSLDLTLYLSGGFQSGNDDDGVIGQEGYDLLVAAVMEIVYHLVYFISKRNHHIGGAPVENNPLKTVES